MENRFQLSVKSRLMIMLIAMTVVPILVIGYLGWKSSRDTITTNIFNHLTSVRATKAYQIESYIQSVRDHVAVLSEDEMIIRAMVRFNKSFKSVEYELVPKEWEEEIEAYYTKEFFPSLHVHISGKPNFEFYKPESTAARYLQHWYIAANEYPVGEKHQLTHPGDESEYSQWHEHYHPLFLHILQRYGYYDLFLIDFETENLIYSVIKEPDLGTNLSSGPYANSGLAEVVGKVRERPEFGSVQVADFRPYTPSNEKPTAFFAAPIFNGPHIVGILAMQIPTDEVDKIMTGNQNWKADGLGASGETYLVGLDFLMRSNSRFLIEDPDGYVQALRKANAPADAIDLVKHLKNSILRIQVDTEASRRALEGETGTRIVKDYRRVPVFSAYAPLHLKDLHWAILSEQDVAEAMKPLSAQQRRYLIACVLLLVLITFAAVILANRFMRPLEALIATTKDLEAGQYHVDIQTASRDEFGQLGLALKGIVGNLLGQSEQIEQKNYENRTLLANVLPPGPAERLQRGDGHIADHIRQVTVLYASVDGFSDLVEKKEAFQAAEMLNALWGMFHDVADAHGVEPHQTMGERYLAVCGLAGVYLDHAKRMLDFSLAIQEALEGFNRDRQTDFRLRIAVHSGALTAGIVGVQRFKYDVWGKTLETLIDLHHAAEPGAVLVSHAIYEQAHESYHFGPHAAIERPGQDPSETWLVEAPVEQVSRV